MWRNVGRCSQLLFTLAAAGCGAADDGTWSSAELDVIRSELGTLPSSPYEDPTNVYGDDPAAAALGQRLFFDSRYSANGNVACATCHDPERGFQDGRANTSEGLQFTERHAPTLINAAFGTGAEASNAVWQFWDGRKDSLWSQVLAPPENDIEMGSSRTRVALLIADLYREEYEAVFGALPSLRDAAGGARFPDNAKPGTPEWEAMSAADRDLVTGVYVNFGKAVAAYERRIVSRNSRFDRFHAEIAGGASDSQELSSIEKKGLRLFLGKGACVECHKGANFSDWEFHNIALDQEGPHLPSEDPGREAGIAALRDDEFNCNSRWSDVADKPSCAVNALAAEPSDIGAFKTPGLRDVARTAPYMHTGTLNTLEDVIDHYDRGGDESGFAGSVDEKIGKLDLATDEVNALVAFLEALNGEPIDPELTSVPSLP